MAANRLRQPADPGLQPERTSLAWLRTFLGYGALLALALRHSWQQSETLFWLALFFGLAALAVLYGYARWHYASRIPQSDDANPAAVQAKLLIALAVCGLALLFGIVHLGKIVALMGAV